MKKYINIYWNKTIGLGFAAGFWRCVDDKTYDRSRRCIEYKIFVLNAIIAGSFPVGKWVQDGD